MKKPEVRIRPADGREIRLMAATDGWAMVRISRCVPFVIQLDVWNSWKEKA